ncbi:DUF6602 domain-containing protein [Pseudonocardia acidicola]|uniref:DUF6602 domain-containing protein n=1 Tax=Pseudonocardia acidicola TaxID=2724939 RepID=A0ABX1SKM7_9PSEU|nr:DUF6602 domain-containing protein [Pseudonocardia acidicola]NMI02087.1 hypothetical protein [Pseudonocardia acidicola]
MFNRLIGHAGEQGRENEGALITLLENLLPGSIGVGTGIVIDSKSRRSRQSDVILYDPTSQPTVMAQVNQMIFPVEVVSTVIEVKTTLAADDLNEFKEKKAAIRALESSDETPKPTVGLFAYHAWASPSTVADHVRAMDAADRPDVLCIVSPGVIGWSDESADSYTIEFVPLHQRDSGGERVADTWRKFDTIPPGGSVVVDGVAHPVTRIAGNGYIVGEPGRTLLLFANRLLGLLAGKYSLPDPVMRHYLDDRAREALRL